MSLKEEIKNLSGINEEEILTEGIFKKMKDSMIEIKTRRETAKKYKHMVSVKGVDTLELKRIYRSPTFFHSVPRKKFFGLEFTNLGIAELIIAVDKDGVKKTSFILISEALEAKELKKELKLISDFLKKKEVEKIVKMRHEIRESVFDNGKFTSKDLYDLVQDSLSDYINKSPYTQGEKNKWK